MSGKSIWEMWNSCSSHWDYVLALINWSSCLAMFFLGRFAFSVNKQQRRRREKLKLSNHQRRIDFRCSQDASGRGFSYSLPMSGENFETLQLKVRVWMCRSASERERERICILLCRLSALRWGSGVVNERTRERESFEYENIDRFYCLKQGVRVLASMMAEACPQNVVNRMGEATLACQKTLWSV